LTFNPKLIGYMPYIFG